MRPIPFPRRPGALLLAAALLPGPALAQTPPSAAEAQALERQAAAALGALLPGAKLPQRPVQLAAEDDHYRVRVPLAAFGVARIEPPDAAFTANAKPLGGTLWSLADQRLPGEFTFTAAQSVPDPPDAKPSPSGRHDETVAYTVKLGQQDSSGTFDSALASPTSGTVSIASLDILREGDTAAAVTHLGHIAGMSSTEPTDPAHVNLLSDSTAQDYASHSELPDGTQVSLAAARLRVVTSVSGLAHAALAPLLQQVSRFSLETKAGGRHPPGLTPAERATLRAVLQDTRDLLTGARLDETAEGLKFNAAGHAGSLDRLEIVLGGAAPQATLDAEMTLALDGLTLDDLPPQLAAYVPSHFSIHPTVSNLSVAALTKAGLDATEPAAHGPGGAARDRPGDRPENRPENRVEPDLQALFAQGGIQFGFDSLVLQVAEAKLGGTGKFVMTGPGDVTGQAEIVAEGLDGLLARAQADPVMQQAVPALIFLKGIAKTDGSQATWLLTVDRDRLLVNGVDLSALTGRR